MQMQKSQIQIFLAHAREDSQKVLELYERLKQEGYKPWLDKKNLIPGQNWREEIPKAIKKSHLFIACLSQESVRKQGYIQREFKLAINEFAERPSGAIYLIPLRLDDCEIPDLQQAEYGIKLRDLQWLDYWEPEGFDHLVRAIEHQFPTQEGKVSQPMPLPTKNRVYEDFARRLEQMETAKQLRTRELYTRQWLAGFDTPKGEPLTLPKLKKYLKSLGYYDDIKANRDGNQEYTKANEDVFDRETVKAIMWFQKKNGLSPIDGIFGYDSWQKLNPQI